MNLNNCAKGLYIPKQEKKQIFEKMEKGYPLVRMVQLHYRLLQDIQINALALCLVAKLDQLQIPLYVPAHTNYPPKAISYLSFIYLS